MLRAALKHGISRALSARTGFEVWDFEIKEEQPSPERTTVEIRFRYHPSLIFVATICAKIPDGGLPVYEITAEAIPGEVGEKEILALSDRQDLCRAIELWTSRIEEELLARPSNRVLVAQQKAISYLEKHLLDIPDGALTRDQIREYRRRLERLQTAVIEVRGARAAGAEARASDADAIRREFDCLRDRLEVLGERSFLHAVLVRLVKYFWDDENLRIVEAGSRAAQDFLREEERMPAPPGAKAPPLPAPPAAPPAPAKRDAVPPAPKASEKPSEVGRLAPPAERLRAEYKPLRPKGA